MTSPRAVEAATFGCWVVKRGSGPGAPDVAGVTGCCLRPSYRADLVATGQPVLLWLSGGDAAGIHAQGTTTGPVRAREPDDEVEPGAAGSRTLTMPVALAPLVAPVLRSELLAHPVLSRIEVVRMAAGSNPSYLTAEQLAVLVDDWPQVRTTRVPDA